MKIPLATYRLQFNPQFTFKHAQDIIGYLNLLGMTDIYASPIFKSKKDSAHGYDTVDLTQIDPQLGGHDDFQQLAIGLRKKEMGWIQDIVPNHMAFDSDNHVLMDIFEKGPLSQYYHFFDIQWDHPYPHLKGKMLAPFLGDLYGACLDRNEIKIHYDQNGFAVCFNDERFPLKIESYLPIIFHNLAELEAEMQTHSLPYAPLLDITNGLRHLSHFKELDEYDKQTSFLKKRLWNAYSSVPAIKKYMDSVIAALNGRRNDPRSLDALDALLSQQFFRLSFWKVGNEELNYRRFFTINSLVGLRMEDQDVFEYAHALLSELIKKGNITGLRIDHIDGLYDPLGYLSQLRQRHQDAYIVVEKILSVDEELPQEMPVQGTTGYDFMNMVNDIFIDQRNEKAFDRIYTSFTGIETSYGDLVRENKRYFMGKFMAGDIDNLALLLKQILDRNRYGRDMTMYALRRAMVEIMAQFPVYRAYGVGGESSAEKLRIKEAVALAQNRTPALAHELGFIQKILLQDLDKGDSGQERGAYHHFFKKFNQFSGALMAKGAEDTSFYIYNRFISLNEVGGDPSLFGRSVSDFHEFMSQRQKSHPLSMNATATHDTKRGEDVRARLNVLSHIPHEWEGRIRSWNHINRKWKKEILALKVRAPSRNDEYLIYQTLIGTFPFNDAHLADYIKRIKEYILKAIREGQIYTSWMQPNADYENACMDFLEKILNGEGKAGFMESFLSFQRKVALKGVYNSLSQVLLKMTSPGIPDFYQGTELWDFSLVDPDNRRAVDYTQRDALLNMIKKRHHEEDFIYQLLKKKEDGSIKLFFMFKILEARRARAEVFLKGEYIPLEVQGPLKEHVVAFARVAGSSWALTIIRLHEDGMMFWKKTKIILPESAPHRWKNVLTDKTISTRNEIPLEYAFHPLPMAFFLS